jgi:hypothetical protein
MCGGTEASSNRQINPHLMLPAAIVAQRARTP